MVAANGTAAIVVRVLSEQEHRQEVARALLARFVADADHLAGGGWWISDASVSALCEDFGIDVQAHAGNCPRCGAYRFESCLDVEGRPVPDHADRIFGGTE